MNQQELIFVYNADSGRWSGYLDMAHKIFSPKTYPCKLCDITHNVFSAKPQWTAFVETIPVKTTFLHKDEWEKEYQGLEEKLPAIFLREGKLIQPFLDANTLNSMKLEDLMGYIERKLKPVDKENVLPKIK